MSARQIRQHIALLTKSDDARKLAALDGLLRFGPLAFEAVPALKKFLSDNRHNDPLHFRALQVLGRVGPASAAALSEMAQSLGDSTPTVRNAALKAVGGVGPVAVPELLHTVQYDSGDGKAHAIRALGALGAEARVALPHLLHIVLFGKSALARQAAAALVGLDHATKASTKAVVELFKGAKADDKLGLIEKLWRLPDALKAALPMLRATLSKEPKEGKPDLRRRALNLAARMGPAAEPLLPEILPFLQGPETNNRTAAVAAVGRIRSAAAVPALLELLPTAGEVRKVTLIDALGRIGPPAAAVVPTIIQLLPAAFGQLRETLLAALSRVGPAAVEARPAVLALLNDPNAPVRALALDTLAAIGLKPESVGAVRPFLDAADEASRLAAVRAIGATELPPEQVAMTLMPRLEDAASGVRRAAVLAIAKSGGQVGPDELERLRGLTQGIYAEPRFEAAEALWRFTKKSAEALPLLTGALTAPDRGVRRSALALLAEMAETDKAALPVLARALAAPDEPIGRPAATALVKLGKAAVPTLIAQLKDEKSLPAARTGSLGVLTRLRADTPELRGIVKGLLDDNEPELRWSAARYTAELGAPADTHAELVTLLADNAAVVRGWAVLGLASVGAPVAPLLVPLLQRGAAVAQEAACDVLARVGPPAIDALPALAGVLGTPDHPARERALDALRSISREVRESLKPVMELLESRQPAELREWGAMKLVERGEVVVPLLIEMLADSTAYMGPVYLAARELGPKAAPLTALLVERLRTEEDDPEEILAALAAIGPSAVPAIVQASRSETRSVQLAAIGTLGRLGPAAAAAVPELIALVRDTATGNVPLFATEALGLIGPDAVAKLIDAAQSERGVPERTRFVHALGVIGTPAAAALPALADAVGSDDAPVALEAIWAVGRLPVAGEKARVADAMLARLAGSDERVAQQAAVSLGRLARGDDKLVPTLVKSAEKATGPALDAALLALREAVVGATALPKGTTDVLTTVLSGDHPPATRRLAADVAARALPADPKALGPVVDSLLADPRIPVRLTVIAALGGTGKAGVEALTAAFASDLPVVRVSAFRALREALPGKEFEPFLRRALEDANAALVVDAIEGLTRDRAVARSVEPKLLEMLRSPLQVIRDRAYTALTELKTDGAKMAEALVAALVEPTEAVRAVAAERLASLGEQPATVAAAPLLVLLMAKSARSWSFSRVLKAIGQPAVPAIKAMIRHPEEAVRFAVVDSLANLDWQTAQALRPFRKQFGNPTPDVVEKLDEAFAAFPGSTSSGGSPANLGDMLGQLKNSGSWWQRQQAANAIAALIKADKVPAEDFDKTLEALRKGVKDSDNDVRECSIKALIEFGARAAPAMGEFLDALTDSHPRVRTAALDALAKVGGAGELPLEPVEKLIKAKGSAADSVEVACSLLHRCGKIPPKTIERVFKLLERPEATVRAAALRALSLQPGADARKLRPNAEKAFESPDPREQLAACEVLATLDRNTSGVQDTLTKLFACRLPAVVDRLAELSKTQAAPSLAGAASSPEPRLRRGAVAVAAKAGAADLLARLAEDSDADTREAARKAIAGEQAEANGDDGDEDEDEDYDD